MPSTALPHLPPAVLWDMDGTLIDSEPISIAHQFALIEQYGGQWSLEQSLALVGTDMHRTADALRAAGVPVPKPTLVTMLEDAVMDALRKEVTWRPGAVDLLSDLHRHGVRSAIVTTSAHEKADLVASRLPSGSISVVVCAEDTPQTKPFPDPYLLAAKLLDVDIAECVAVEDSANGLRSAVSAGAQCIAVPGSAPLPTEGPWTVWDTLQNRGAVDFAEFARGGTTPGA